MIFKLNSKGTPISIDPAYLAIGEKFSFSGIRQIVYDPNIGNFINLQSKIDAYIYPDLIASLYKKMYEHGFTKRFAIISALLSCSAILQVKNFEFLGFLIKGDELSNRLQNLDSEFITNWDFSIDPSPGDYRLKLDDNLIPIKQTMDNVFIRSDFRNSFNVFFVAGAQTLEMIDLRIKMAALLFSKFIKNDYFDINNSRFILSGWNNAKIPHSKVKFSNESLIMRNLIIHKLNHYLSNNDSITNIDGDFYNNNIISEINSRNTEENILELFKLLDDIYELARNNNNSIINLFVVSSTFHLLQLADKILKPDNKKYFSSKSDTSNIITNVFLIGSENPDHFFKTYDSHYIKLLFNEVVQRNFNFFTKEDLRNE